MGNAVGIDEEDSEAIHDYDCCPKNNHINTDGFLLPYSGGNLFAVKGRKKKEERCSEEGCAYDGKERDLGKVEKGNGKGSI